MDQLFSLGHVSGATKIRELARRGMTSAWFPAEKCAGLLTPVENPHLDGAGYLLPKSEEVVQAGFAEANDQ
ncbi:MAG: hypothetical protein JWR80_1364 [Bradyrhizobium sp.]|nr:hypothetical protein [Bradyrhizobium sp.]